MTTLPGKESMLNLLLSVEKSMYYQVHLYPIFLNISGKQKTPLEVVIHFMTTIQGITHGMPGAIVASVYAHVPEFIEVLFAENEPFRAEALRIFQEEIDRIE